MGRKKIEKPATEAEEPQENKTEMLTVRGTKEWRDWVYAFADFERVPIPSLFDRALISHAKVVGFEPPAPKR